MTEGNNIAPGSMGLGVAPYVDRYLPWVGAVEGQLRNFYVDQAVWERLPSLSALSVRSLMSPCSRTRTASSELFS